MAYLNSLCQSHIRKCWISSCKVYSYLLNFQKRTYTTSSFNWRNCYKCVNDILFSKTDHNCLVTRNQLTVFKRHNCSLTKNFRLRSNVLSMQIQHVQLYSSEKGKENKGKKQENSSLIGKSLVYSRCIHNICLKPTAIKCTEL